MAPKPTNKAQDTPNSAAGDDFDRPNPISEFLKLRREDQRKKGPSEKCRFLGDVWDTLVSENPILGVEYYLPPAEDPEDAEMFVFTSLERQQSDIHVYTGPVTDQEAETMLKKFLEEAEASRGWLRDTLEKYGNEFFERWPNSVNERKSIFTRACIDMDQRKFPFIQAIYDQMDWSDRRKKFRNGLLLPYINVETMAEDHHTFLSLLYNRSAHEVGDFTYLDLELLLPGDESGICKWLARCTHHTF